MERFSLPLAVNLALLPILVFDSILRKWISTKIINFNHISIFIIAILFSLGFSLILHSPFEKNFNTHERAKLETYRVASNWLNENAPKGSTVGANEIGVIGYHYQNGKIIDGLGLVTKGVGKQVAQKNYSWYIHEYKPDYLVFKEPYRPILEAMVNKEWFTMQYKPVHTISSFEYSVKIYQRQFSE